MSDAKVHIYNLQSKYYVTFFNEEKLEANWILKRNLKPLATNKYSTLIKKVFNLIKFNLLNFTINNNGLYCRQSLMESITNSSYRKHTKQLQMLLHYQF